MDPGCTLLSSMIRAIWGDRPDGTGWTHGRCQSCPGSIDGASGRPRRARHGLGRLREGWRRHYNETRPHSSLGYLTSAEFKQLGSKTNPEKSIFQE
ncbi:MAG: integrase core domain-containing protein [Steroidobacteraceae bacterium]